MGASPGRKWIRHLVVIFVAIKAALYIKRNWRTEYEVDPINVESGLGPVKNPDNTFNILNQVFRFTTTWSVTSLVIINFLNLAEECELPSISLAL